MIFKRLMIVVCAIALVGTGALCAAQNDRFLAGWEDRVRDTLAQQP